MPKSATNLAHKLLSRADDAIEDLEIHQFRDDAESLDDEGMQRLYANFEAMFEGARSELSASYGQPVRTGADYDGDISLNGIVRFAIWKIEGKLLYVAFAHEDHTASPYLLSPSA